MTVPSDAGAGMPEPRGWEVYDAYGTPHAYYMGDKAEASARRDAERYNRYEDETWRSARPYIARPLFASSPSGARTPEHIPVATAPANEASEAVVAFVRAIASAECHMRTNCIGRGDDACQPCRARRALAAPSLDREGTRDSEHCSQCGQMFTALACGPTHALIAHERFGGAASPLQGEARG